MKSKGFLRLIMGICLILALALLPFMVAYAQQKPTAVKYDVGGTNLAQGAYHITVAMCSIVNKYAPNITLTPKVTSSPTENLRLINAGSIPLGYVSEMACYSAIRGFFPFKEKITPNLRMLFCDQGFTYPIMASVGSGIKSIADLKGKKMVGWSVSSVYGKANLLAALEVYGVAVGDVTILEGKSTPECLRMLQEGIVDATSFPMTPNSAGVVDLLANRPCVFVSIPREINEKIVKIALEKYQTMLMPLTLPASTYEGQKKDLIYAGSPDGWAGTTDISDDTAYQIVKALFDNEDEFLAQQPGKMGLKGVTRETAVDAMFAIPYYPGAVKYYKEKGWWTPEMERKQQHVLAEMVKLAEKYKK